jgi:hypothetical protein
MGRCCKQAKRKVMKPAVKEGLKEGLFSRVMEEEWAVGGELWSFEVLGQSRTAINCVSLAWGKGVAFGTLVLSEY